jgi:hypothetical protein
VSVPSDDEVALTNTLLLGGEFRDDRNSGWYVAWHDGQRWRATSTYGEKAVAASMFLRRRGYRIGWTGELEKL